MTGVVQWIPISPLEDTGKAGEVVGCMCLWAKIRGKVSRVNIMVVGVCYIPPNQDEQTEEAFYKQLAEVSWLLTLVFMGDFNLPDAFWKHNKAKRKQSRKFLECLEDNFLTQLVNEPAREGVLLLIVNTEGLVSDLLVNGYLGHSGQEMFEFQYWVK